MRDPMTTRVAPDGALLRLTVDGDDWGEHLPPVPPGQDVTVAFSTADAEAVHAEALALLGYRVVGEPAATTGDAVAEVLVRQAVLEAHPTWWRALAALADRAYNLAHGPAAALLAPALAPHLAR
jgi:hypothetical protein